MFHLSRLPNVLETFPMTTPAMGRWVKQKGVDKTSSLIDIAEVNGGRCIAEYFGHLEDILGEYSLVKAILACVGHHKKRLGQVCDRTTQDRARIVELDIELLR